MQISPSSLEKYTDCPRKWWYHYVAKVKAKSKSATLFAGIILHEVFNTIVKSEILGHTCDPVQLFESTWNETLARENIRYSTTQSPEGMLATGKRIAELFPAAWKNTGLIPVIDPKGVPVLERKFTSVIAPGLTVLCIVDGLFMSTNTGQVVPLDFKCPAQPPDPLSTTMSDQLSIQQLLVNNEATSLGIEQVDAVGFMAAIRRPIGKTRNAKGPEILPPSIVPARTPAQLAELRQRIVWTAEDITRGRFPKTPRMPHNTPCDLCDYAMHCAYGSEEGLIFPESFQLPLVA
jgi:hypothetical protein